MDKLGRYFFASVLDEEDCHVVSLHAFGRRRPGSGHGLVTKMSGDEFTIDPGLRFFEQRELKASSIVTLVEELG